MKEEEFFLTWNDYSNHMKQMLQDLMTYQSFTDVTLVCDDKIQLEAHKIILISCSKFFETILNQLTQSSEYKPIIYLKGINHHEMEAILHFMYLGEAKFSQERTSEFLRAATELELKSMSQDTNNMQNDTSVEDKLTELHNNVSKNGAKMEDHMIESHTSRSRALVALNNSECPNMITSKDITEADEKSKIENQRHPKERFPAILPQIEQTPNLTEFGEESNLEQQRQLDKRSLENHQNLIRTTEDSELIKQKQPEERDLGKGTEYQTNANEVPYQNEETEDKTSLTIKAAEDFNLQQQKQPEERTLALEFVCQNEQTRYLINENDLKYECNTCSQYFSDEAKLNHHNNQYHPRPLNLICWCGFQADTKADVDIHKLKSHNEKSCTKCDFTADTYSKIFYHFKLVHKPLLVGVTKEEDTKCDKYVVPYVDPSTKKSFSCDKCEFETNKGRNLKRHSDDMHGTTFYKKIRYPCDQCEYTSRNRVLLEKHIHSQHIAKESKKCKYCDFTCDKSELKEHLLRNHKVDLSNNCEHCDFKATQKSELREHLNTTHSQFQCNKCKYSTYRKAEYDHHFNMKHSNKELEDKIEFKIASSGEETFFCKECPYNSQTNQNIRRHIRSEHLHLKHPCDQCGHEFTNSSNLHQHIKRKHTKNFSWQCDQCEKQFLYEYNLRTHVNSKHLGIRHPCSKCKSEFPNLNNLQKHFRKYHS